MSDAPERIALREAARLVDCACENKAKVAALPAKNSGERWRLCGAEPCGAIEAAAILALMEDRTMSEEKQNADIIDDLRLTVPALRAHIEELEVKLAQAVEALETIVDNGGAGSYHLARTTLAELKGENQ